LPFSSGIAGGVVSQAFFQKHFGLVKEDGTIDTKRSNEVSSNVVSVLQAGAFFGALGSAPISGLRFFASEVRPIIIPAQPTMAANGHLSVSLLFSLSALYAREPFFSPF